VGPGPFDPDPVGPFDPDPVGSFEPECVGSLELETGAVAEYEPLAPVEDPVGVTIVAGLDFVSVGLPVEEDVDPDFVIVP